MQILVTGGAGFIGSNLVDALLADGHDVTVLDNLSTGHQAFLRDASLQPSFTMMQGDLLDQEAVDDAVNGKDAIVHLAANADVRFGWNHPRRDHEQNVVATQNVLEAMRQFGVRRLLFSSTGSVYGEATTIPTPENAPFPLQTSLYGSSKMAAEGLIAAYAHAGHLSATIFRFVSILGPRYTHGHVIDFVARLSKDPSRLPVLGDGTQRKSYLYVDDCIAAIKLRLATDPGLEVLNLGTDEFCKIADSARWIADRLGLSPTFEYSGGDRGWVGDNPFIFLDTAAMRTLGWAPKRTIRGAVEATVDWLVEHPDVLDAAITT